MTKEEAVVRANTKYSAKYVLVCLGLMTITTLILWDAIFWTLLGVTLLGLWIYNKIWG